MADPQAPATDAPEAAEATEADTGATGDTADTSGESAAPKSSTPRLGLQGLLSRDSDSAARPGFRNPSNNRSKAQKKKSKGGKKKR